MEEITLPLHLQAMGHLYRRAFPIYRPLYFLYKRFSDRRRLSLLKHLVVPGMVVMDVGANIGFYTSALLLRVGRTGHVHCFEPNKTNFAHLSSLVSHYPNITVNQCAIGSEGGGKLFVNSSSNIDHRLAAPSVGEGMHGGRDTVAVDVVTLDDYCDKLGRVDFVKMDIQGGEYEALQGMLRTFERFPELLLIMEYWPFGLLRAGVEPSEMLELITLCGLRYIVLDGHVQDVRQMKACDPLSYTDLLVWSGRSKRVW